mmetsp:Transcript_53429/g.173834  ORF Transcript_53429/g.173834 Transcript_53429/m.173834 type:complete len:299 (-) Transcript_53429:570-1466(-)
MRCNLPSGFSLEAVASQRRRISGPKKHKKKVVTTAVQNLIGVSSTSEGIKYTRQLSSGSPTKWKPVMYMSAPGERQKRERPLSAFSSAGQVTMQLEHMLWPPCHGMPVLASMHVREAGSEAHTTGTGMHLIQHHDLPSPQSPAKSTALPKAGAAAPRQPRLCTAAAAASGPSLALVASSSGGSSMEPNQARPKEPCKRKACGAARASLGATVARALPTSSSKESCRNLGRTSSPSARCRSKGPLCTWADAPSASTLKPTVAAISKPASTCSGTVSSTSAEREPEASEPFATGASEAGR